MPKPSNKDMNPFTEEIYGVFGRFKTSESYEVNYILSCLSIQDIGRLDTAHHAFEFSNINFEDLMQRDVDLERVDQKIIKKYLEKGLGRVLFFPPIIVSVITLENDRIKDVYDKVEYLPPEQNEDIKLIFDSDKFCVELSPTKTGHPIHIEGETYYYNPAWSLFKYNKNKVKLIVIDGQHRFEALRRTKNRDLLQSVELPVCIVFTPATQEQQDSPESIVRILRDMFVTINTTAKEVSGHFIDLLKDQSLASMAVRSLANKWKQSHQDPCRSMLQHLEWNERSDSLAYTVQRKHSITTVSILADSLRYYAFSSSKNGIPYYLLNLQAVQSDFEENPDSIDAEFIQEDKFHPSQEDILKQQIEQIVTPSLNILFTKPSPYQEIIRSFLHAVDKLDEEAKSGVKSASTYRDEVLSRFRRCTSEDASSILNYEENEFDVLILRGEGNDIYFKNVFQQALVGLWVQLSANLFQVFSLSPVKFAEILVDSLDKFAFKPQAKIFEPNMPYTNLIIYSGSKILSAQYAKNAWTDLLAASLLYPDSRQCLYGLLKQETSSESEVAFQYVIDFAKESLADYTDSLKRRIFKGVEKEWRSRPYGRVWKDKLEKLLEEDNTEFLKQIEKKADEELQEALEKLGNRLEMDLTTSKWEKA
jgi:hypothetical protein